MTYSTFCSCILPRVSSFSSSYFDYVPVNSGGEFPYATYYLKTKLLNEMPQHPTHYGQM